MEIKIITKTSKEVLEERLKEAKLLRSSCPECGNPTTGLKHTEVKGFFRTRVFQNVKFHCGNRHCGCEWESLQRRISI